jgi:hypothetical protein
VTFRRVGCDLAIAELGEHGNLLVSLLATRWVTKWVSTVCRFNVVWTRVLALISHEKVRRSVVSRPSHSHRLTAGRREASGGASVPFRNPVQTLSWCRSTVSANSTRGRVAISGSRSTRPARSRASPASGPTGRRSGRSGKARPSTTSKLSIAGSAFFKFMRQYSDADWLKVRYR